MSETHVISEKVTFFSTKRLVALAAVILLVAGAFAVAIWSSNSRVTSSKTQALAGVDAYRKGNFSRAIPRFAEAARLDPKNAAAQYGLGQTYEATGKLEQAAKAYGDSLKADPKQPQALYSLAIIYKSQNKTKAAVVELEKATRLNKQFVAARLILGDLYAQAGEKAKAARQYQAVIDLKPFGTDLAEIKSKLEKVR